jgi:hypothetical protein
VRSLVGMGRLVRVARPAILASVRRYRSSAPPRRRDAMTGLLSGSTSGSAARSTLTTSSASPQLNPRAKGWSFSEFCGGEWLARVHVKPVEYRRVMNLMNLPQLDPSPCWEPNGREDHRRQIRGGGYRDDLAIVAMSCLTTSGWPAARSRP